MYTGYFDKNIDRSLFKLYVLLLPLGRFIKIPWGDFLTQVFPHLSTVVMLIGILFLIIRRVRFIDDNIRLFYIFWRFTVVYTVLACSIFVVIYSIWGIEGVDQRAWLLEYPFRACARDLVMYFLCLLSLLYSYYNLAYIIKFEDLKGVFEFQIMMVLGLGCIQYGVVHGNGLFVGIYNLLGFVFNIVSLDFLTSVDRGVCFWGSEPSSASALCMFCVPYTFISFVRTQGWKKFRFGIYLVLFLYFFLTSGSSSVLISFFVVLACFAFYLLRIKLKLWMFYSAFLFGLVVATLYSLDLQVKSNYSDYDRESIEYIVLGKLLDKSNGSTAMRVSSVCNDMLIVQSFPLTGVGNGNQGYFYVNNVPLWTREFSEVQRFLYYETGLSNGGGNFFASYFSGYGFIGLIMLWHLVRKYRIRLRSSMVAQIPLMRLLFGCSIMIFLLSSWYVTGIEDNTLLFVLALGCVRMSRIDCNSFCLG